MSALELPHVTSKQPLAAAGRSKRDQRGITNYHRWTLILRDHGTQNRWSHPRWPNRFGISRIHGHRSLVSDLPGE